MFAVYVTYPENINHKVFDKFFISTEEKVKDTAIHVSKTNPEALILIFNNDVLIYIYQNEKLQDRVESTEYYINLKTHKPNWDNVDDSSMEHLLEEATWDVAVNAGKPPLYETRYTFKTGMAADAFAKDISKENPNIRVNLWYGTACRKAYVDGILTLDIPDYDHYFIKEDNDYFKNCSIIWRDLL